MSIEATHVSGTWWRHVPSGSDVLARPDHPPDMRWQHGDVVAGLYLGDSPDTVWAEWYRWLAEAGLPPMQGLPRDLWAWEVSLPRVADLSDATRLEAAGLSLPEPGRNQWPEFQSAGEKLFNDGWPALLAPSAARPSGFVLCVFREAEEPAGVVPQPPPERFDEPPVPPSGMTT